ncbi:GntR family transcriptional regulator [Leptolyngbya sp. 7M]|uniref:GntR family transcriptional regulator n=1 Tax=Leptolyngbya sp. 7M TaxID=2812896 RepID=UPI001B8C9F1D|nr:GntR family transcriptional regulator [Leptolyngbya sp. 7M]QYO63074.1 GntR family transcriptional regulator [Leptolyngbya sp. 7M]
MPSAKPKSSSSVDRIYHQLREMAMNYKFRPGEPLNETELAASLGVSRTPLREVLNRLVAEGLLEFIPRRGFSGRPLEQKMIFDLYEMRSGLEMISARLATERATDAEVEDLIAWWEKVALNFDCFTSVECAQADEDFHQRLASLSHNTEILHTLDNLNARVHFLRLISLEQESFRHSTCEEHHRILSAIKQRDANAAANLMYAHVKLRQAQLVEVIKEAVARLYME